MDNSQGQTDSRMSSSWSRFRRQPFLLTVPALTLVVLVMAVPLITIMIRSFTDPVLGFGNYTWFFGHQLNLTVLSRTFSISLWVTVSCVVFAYPYAFAMSVAGPRTRLLLVLCVLVPFWVSGVVRTLAWVIILQDSGVINQAVTWLGFEKLALIRTKLGVTIGMTQVLLPFMVMPLFAVMRGIDLRLIQAAKSLGSTPIKAFSSRSTFRCLCPACSPVRPSCSSWRLASISRRFCLAGRRARCCRRWCSNRSCRC